MANRREHKLPLLMRRCRYSVTADLEFAGLWASEGKEIARIRFSRGYGTLFDIRCRQKPYAL